MPSDLDLKQALLRQYRAGFAMLRQAIEKCPDDLWTSGTHPRTFWRIAYHTLFYTHFYLMLDHESFAAWDRHVPHGVILWDDDEAGVPPNEHPYSQADLMGYLDQIVEGLPAMLDAIDLDAPESGFPWYPISKLEHQFVNLRHVQGHVGQLSELLMAKGIDVDWAGSR